jgi:hypothetical protein
MDLRPFIKTPEQLEAGLALIRSGHLFYQPFILAEDVEVGEGQNLHDEYKDALSVNDLNVYAPRYDVGMRRQPAELSWFRKCNAEYRRIYDHIADRICELSGRNIKKLTVGEIGCNTGLTLFNLAARGAKACYGYDWNDMSPVFDWLNGLLGTQVHFQKGNYNNLVHRFNELNVGEVDVMVNTVFTNHQCDPLQFLCYLCDRARKGVFLWALVDPGIDEPCILYPAPPDHHEIMPNDKPFPLYFYNGVALSEPLLRLALERLGFGEVTHLPKLPLPGGWDRFQEGFRMYYAKRTSDARSAYWTEPSAQMRKLREVADSTARRVRLPWRVLPDAFALGRGNRKTDAEKPPAAPGRPSRLAALPGRLRSKMLAVAVPEGSQAAICGGDGSGKPECAFDGDPNTFWISSQRGIEVKDQAWVGYGFAEPVRVAGLRVVQSDRPGYRQDLIRIEKSTDEGANWTPATPDVVRLIGSDALIELPEGPPARLWRIVAAADNSSEPGEAWSVVELKFYTQSLASVAAE